MLSVLTSAFAVFMKDLRIEVRTREVTTTAGFFAILLVVMCSLGFVVGGTAGQGLIAPGALWLSVAFASVLAIGRSWQREREESTLTALLVAPIPRSAIFLGKALGIFVFLVTVEAVVVPIVALFFHLDLLSLGGVLAVVLLLGTFGVAFAGTLFGAMTAKTRARDLVLASVLFPLLSPTLLSGVSASKELLSGHSLEQISDWLLLLSVFDFVALAGGVGLFETLVED